jgi:tetratricopeptide (TPR) repeat protein
MPRIRHRAKGFMDMKSIVEQVIAGLLVATIIAGAAIIAGAVGTGRVELIVVGLMVLATASGFWWGKQAARTGRSAQDAAPTQSPAQPTPTEVADDLIKGGEALMGLLLDLPQGHEDPAVFELAVRLYERATELAPDNNVAWFDLTYPLLRLNREQEALEAFEMVVALNPTDVRAWEWKGHIHSGRGQYDEALSAFMHALASNPQSKDARQGFDDALRALGRGVEAETSIRLDKVVGG